MKPTLEQIKTGSDWLQVNSKVMTPKGTATVNKITEDDGVFTTLGNYCRSELSPSKAFVHGVGFHGECTYAGRTLECVVVLKNKVCIFDRGVGWITAITPDLNIRPIKSDREKFVEPASKILQLHDQDVTDLCNKSVNMFRSQAEALYDSGKFKLVEAEE